MAITKEEIKKAESLAKRLVDSRATTSQLRKFMTDITRLRVKSEMLDWKEKIYPEFLMLSPRLEYQIAKDTKPNQPSKLEALKELIPEINRIESKEDFQKLALFVEAVIAYHKARGGKDS